MLSHDKFYLGHLATLLIKSRKSHDFFSHARNNLPTEMYGLFVDFLKPFPLSKTHIIGKSKERKVEDLDCLLDLDPLNIQDELKWAKAIISRNYSVINDFTRNAEQYSNALLVGELEIAKSILDTIENEFGYSLWLLKNRIAFLQLSEGLEAQKRYVQEVKDASSYRGLVAYIAHWVSVRNEGTVTASRFINQFDSTLKKLRLGTGHDTYLKYHIMDLEEFTIEEGINILRLDFSRSLVDFYEAFVTLSRVIALNVNEIEIRQHLGYALKKFGDNLVDRRLGIISKVLDLPSTLEPVSSRSIEAYNLYLAGDYDNSLLEALNSLEAEPSNTALLCIAALAKAKATDMIANNHILEQKNRLASQLITKLAIVLNEGATSASQELNDLIKISMNFASLPFTSAITILLEKHHTLYNLPCSSATALAILKAYSFDPYFISEIAGSSITEIYISESTKGLPSSLSIRYLTALAENTDISGEAKLSQEAKSLQVAIVAYRQHQFDIALQESQKLFLSTFSYFKRVGRKLISNSLLSLGKFDALVNFVATTYINDAASLVDFPLKEIIEIVKPENDSWQEVKHLIGWPITLDAYTKNIKRDLESEITYAYEDFLDSLGLKKPSELSIYFNKFDKSELIYFFKNICIESVMDLSTAFAGANEVADQRLLVCNILLDLDPDNFDEYHQEINDLVRKQVVSKMMEEVDQSRIHIDIPKLKEWANLELQESYQRYIAYIRHGISPQIKSLREDAKAKALDNDAEGLYAMKVPENEVNALLVHLISEIRDAYTTNPDFGMERFLSTRIRHGYIETRLRRPIEDSKLITKRTSANGPYKVNEYWIDSDKLSVPFHKRLHQLFSKFSASYDALINKVKSEWLQVRRKNEDKGMFVFMIADIEAELIAAEISKDTSFKEFLDLIIKLLNDKLTHSLTMIRQELQDNAKKEAVNLLNKLQINISSLATTYSYNTSDLDSAINTARTEAQKIIDQIIDWFIPSQSVGSTTYDVSVAVAVAEAIVKQSVPVFNVTTILMDEVTTINIQGGLPTFVDILVNIFENVIKRSGLDVPEAELSVDIENYNDNIGIVNITVINDLGFNIDEDSLRQDLARRKDLLEKGLYKSSISREGGSGFFKIHRSLKDFKMIDIDLDPKLDFGIESQQYFIRISLPLGIQRIEP